MENHSDEEIVRAYLKSWSEGGAEVSWANDVLDDLVQRDPERAWPILLELIAGAPSGTILSILAAGPLENLLCEHGLGFIDRVVIEADHNDRLRDSLASVWGETRMDRDVYRQLKQIRNISGRGGA